MLSRAFTCWARTATSSAVQNTGDRNVISANGDAGIYLQGANGNVVQGNFIGAGIGGGGRFPNGNHGVLVSSGSGNIIGGTAAGSRNLISGNTGSGVFLSGSSTVGTLVMGNYIGADVTGSLVLSNGGYGVSIVGAVSNTVGGSIAGAGNLISGNSRAGVDVHGVGAVNNLVQGNLIGTDATGKLALGNALAGVSMSDATGTVIGGTVAEARNIIAGNKQDGILITTNSARGFVQGNYIGVDITGTNALANTFNGVSISSANSNTIGGVISGARNIISGNASYGIQISSGARSNSIQGNYIGTDVSGQLARANQFSGIRIESANNTVGGTASGARNLISGNGQDGVFLVGAPATGNLIQGNYLGTTVSGAAALKNVRAGIGISGAPGNTIGGSVAGAGNLLSANGDAGIYLITGGATGNQILGNLIGTDFAGTSPLGNAQEGIYVESASGNTIGGAAPGAGNVISGNATWGVFLTNASGTVIKGNLVGTAIDGTSALGNGNTLAGFHAVELQNNCHDNLIGGPEAGAGNRIAFAPTRSGIFYAGIRMRDGATNNLIQGNAIFSNGGLGIDLSTYLISLNDPCDADGGANMQQNFPVLTQAVSGTGVGVRGTLNSKANTTFLLQFFANPSCDTLGYGEGQIYLGEKTVVTSNDCNASFVATVAGHSAGYAITATATDPANNTSEFSACATSAAWPILTVAASSNQQVRFAWTNNPPGFVLKQADSLNAPVQWTTVTNSPATSNGQFVVTQSMTASNRFFLLGFE